MDVTYDSQPFFKTLQENGINSTSLGVVSELVHLGLFLEPSSVNYTSTLPLLSAEISDRVAHFSENTNMLLVQQITSDYRSLLDKCCQKGWFEQR